MWHRSAYRSYVDKGTEKGHSLGGVVEVEGAEEASGELQSERKCRKARESLRDKRRGKKNE